MRFAYTMYWDRKGEWSPVTATIDIESSTAGDYLTSELESTGTFYEDDLLEYIALRGPEGGVYFDVGAHLGNHSVYFAKFAADYVIAVEPNPAIVPLLRRNLEVNSVGNCSVLPCAVGAERGVGHMFYPAGSRGNTGAGQVVRHEHTEDPPGETTLIPIRTLDGLFEEIQPDMNGRHVTFVKVDVEGMQLEALRGATMLLERQRPQLAVELATPEERNAARLFLAGFGYREVGHFCKTSTVHFIHPEVHRLRAIPGLPQPDSATNRFHRAMLEVEALIPKGEAFILVGWGGDFIPGRTALPLPGRHGEYWGPPEDDAVAISELERLRRDGAGFIVFGWPTFWWLDHYREFRSYLRSEFCSMLENERVVILDLCR